MIDFQHFNNEMRNKKMHIFVYSIDNCMTNDHNDRLGYSRLRISFVQRLLLTRQRQNLNVAIVSNKM